jgi:imidazolonepropionase-like amidohydrolase
MRIHQVIAVAALTFAPAFGQSRQASASAAPADSFMLSGGTVHTISGAVIENGSVLVRDGKIVGVGKNLPAPQGYKVIDVRGQQIYPGMIDAASMMGLDSNVAELKSDAEESGLFNPQLRAVTAMNPASEHIPASRANGVTGVIEMPEGDLISGQMSLIHLDDSGNNQAMTVLPSAAIHLRFPALIIHPVRPHESDDADDDPAPPEPIPYEEAKKEYDEKLAALLQFFDEARQYQHAKLARIAGFETNLKLEAMIPVLEGKTPLFVTAVREREIREAVEFADKQKVKIILADAYECYKVIPLIKSHNIPVVLGPTLSLPIDPDDPYDRSFTTPAELQKAGIKFAIATFSARQSRNLPYQAAAAVPFGLAQDDAYRAVSLSAAEIFGVARQMGSIEEGKSADLIVADGDPLEATTNVKMVFIAGKPESLDTRQKQLYEKYSGNPPK